MIIIFFLIIIINDFLIFNFIYLIFNLNLKFI